MKVTSTLVSVLVIAGVTAAAGSTGVPETATASTSTSASASASASVPAPAPARPSLAVRNPAWMWPLAAPHSMVSGFEAPPTAYASGHRGIDIASQPGDPVYAPRSAVVSFAGRVVDRGVLTLAIDGDLLASVEPVVPLVTAGEEVSAGQAIATVDSGGHCAARCLHLGVRLHGRYISPLNFLGGVPLAVLLPVDEPWDSAD